MLLWAHPNILEHVDGGNYRVTGGGEPNGVDSGLDQIAATTAASAATHERYTAATATAASTTTWGPRRSLGARSAAWRTLACPATTATACSEAAAAAGRRRPAHAPLEAVHPGLDLHVYGAGYLVVLEKF